MTKLWTIECPDGHRVPFTMTKKKAKGLAKYADRHPGPWCVLGTHAVVKAK